MSRRGILTGSPPQEGESLVRNWSATLAEARADRNSSGVYLSYPPSALGGNSYTRYKNVFYGGAQVLLSFFHHLYFNIIKFNEILTSLHFL
jgi:hypothetical protein